MLAGLTLVSACSWGRFFFTGSLKVDESYPARTAGFALLAALIAGWALAIAGWRGILERPPENPRRTAFIALGIAALMLPMLSNDVFSVLSYGSLAAGGRDVYTTTRWLAESLFSPFLGARWSQTVCVYGPTTLLASLPAGLARANPWVGLIALRIAWMIPLALVMEISLRRLRSAPSFHAMLWLNPLWIVEGPGQLHADLLGVVAIVAGVLLHRAGKVRASFGLYAAALLGKYSFGPAGLWFWLSEPRSGCKAAGAPGSARRLATMGAVLAAAGVAFYAPFWHGPETITVPLRTLGRMNPGGSITEVLGIVVQYLRSGSVTAPDMAVQAALETDRAAKQASWVVVSWVMRVVFLGVVARVLPPMLRKGAREETIALGTGALAVALLTLASHRFQCWYLVAALPFFGLSSTPVWKRWWTAAVALSVPVDFACVLERTSPVYPVWGALTTGAVVAVFVVWFRGRYWRFPDGAAARRDTTAPAAR